MKPFLKLFLSFVNFVMRDHHLTLKLDQTNTIFAKIKSSVLVCPKAHQAGSISVRIGFHL